MAENKVRFLRGTATEYANATKDDDTFYYTTDDKKFYIGDKEITSEGVTVDDTLSDTSEHPVQNKVIKAALDEKAEVSHTHTVSDISDFPEAFPANGGNSETVNNHTVETDVPANAEFTDTVYTHPSYTARSGIPTANQTPAFGGTFSVTQPVSDTSGHITEMNSRNVTIPSTPASASAAGLVSTGTQTFAGQKTFNGKVIPNGASDVATAQARKISAGTDDLTAGTSALETGAIYIVYE